jgi:hypothetical protein
VLDFGQVAESMSRRGEIILACVFGAAGVFCTVTGISSIEYSFKTAAWSIPEDHTIIASAIRPAAASRIIGAVLLGLALVMGWRGGKTRRRTDVEAETRR